MPSTVLAAGCLISLTSCGVKTTLSAHLGNSLHWQTDAGLMT